MKNGKIIAILLIEFGFISANSFCQEAKVDKKIKFEYKPENFELNKIEKAYILNIKNIYTNKILRNKKRIQLKISKL